MSVVRNNLGVFTAWLNLEALPFAQLPEEY